MDEWWEDLENEELAARAIDAIAGEIRRNRTELEAGPDAPDLAELRDGIGRMIQAYRNGEEPADVGFSVTWNVGLLSSAAWDTAQTTRATQFMPIEQVVDLAQLYEFQRFYAVRQDELAALIGELDGHIESDPIASLKTLRSRYRVVHQLRTSLASEYACALGAIDAALPAEIQACEAEADEDQ